MSKRPFVFFGILCAIVAAIVVGSISSNGKNDHAVAGVPSGLERGKTLFQQSCGACHTLAKAAADGIVGPNLDDLLGTSAPDARRSRVANAIEKGGSGVGKMPAGILTGGDRAAVARFVSRVAGEK